MRTLLPLMALATVACQPPDAVLPEGPAPFIELVHPPQGTPLERQPNGDVDFLAVVWIDGMEFAPELEGEDKTEDQGHWHISLENEYLAAPDELSYAVHHRAYAPPDLTEANSVHVRVSLQHNDHADYNDPDGDGIDAPDWEHIVEFDIVDVDADTGR
ncbi:MAG: hypothetical protein EP330_01515 [Deltaproteobacteria bacterium]|nr:MAG: hypothetical protein EP330_01515 [Deltaproteobacteria bacterium]